MSQQMRISKEQKAYAYLMDICAKSIFVLLVVMFALYVTGSIKPDIQLSDLPNYWHLPLAEFLEQTNDCTGWGWLKFLDKSDYLNFLPIALLASMTFFCYARILPLFIKDKDKWYVIIVIAELIILTLPASGLLTFIL